MNLRDRQTEGVNRKQLDRSMLDHENWYSHLQTLWGRSQADAKSYAKRYTDPAHCLNIQVDADCATRFMV